ncbi:MAG: galactokinase [Phycisphaerales bacterium]|nr:galactokinase [Phycisphaerales bacterium]
MNLHDRNQTAPTHTPAPPALARAHALFTHHFHRQPAITAAAPGRVNLIGEHTDYSGGFVLPIAIDRLCIAAAAPAADPARTRIVSEHGEHIIQLDLRAPLHPGMTTLDGAHLSPGNWASYIAGVLANNKERAQSAGAPIHNLDLAFASDVPLGGGLSSSAALEIAACEIAAASWNLPLTQLDKADLSRQAEHEYAGVPCGLMDQFISAMGRRDHALLIDCRHRTALQVPMPDPRHTVVLVINSNIRHALASGEYAQRRNACTQAAALLGITELRDATPDMIAASSALRARPDLLPIARHITTENTRTLHAADALENNDLALAGALMYESHNSLRDNYRVSCPELDTLVELASSCQGIHGARMTGGGFGGCMIALCRADAWQPAAGHILHAYHQRHQRQATAFITPAGGGSHIL